MRRVYEYSHLGGSEILTIRYPKIEKEIDSIIKNLATPKKTKVSKEKTMRGELLYSPKEINDAFRKSFESLKYEELRDTYTISLPNYATKIPGAFKQIDFVKDRVLVEVQFGKYSFVTYDLFVKHLAFYVGDKIDVGIEVLPMKSLQSEMSSGPGYYEGELYNVIRNGRGVPAVPLVIVGVAE